MLNPHSFLFPSQPRDTRPEAWPHPKGIDSNVSRHPTPTGLLSSDGDQRQIFRPRHLHPITSTSAQGVPLELPSFGSAPLYPPREGLEPHATQPTFAHGPPSSTSRSSQLPTSEWYSDQSLLSQTRMGRNDVSIGTFSDRSGPTPLPQVQSVSLQGSSTVRCKLRLLYS